MEIDITDFFIEADPFKYAHSIAEGGENAGRDTWYAAMQDAAEWNHLDTDEKRENFRDYMEDFGAWTKDEIAGWRNDECEALFLQMISGDLRSANLDDIDDNEQWAEYEKNAEIGRISGNFFRSGGKVYFNMSH